MQKKKKIVLKREFVFFGRRGALGPQVKWGAQVPYLEKKNRAEARFFFFPGKGALGPPYMGGPGPPIYMGGPGPGAQKFFH